jgi:hypothetical protein
MRTVEQLRRIRGRFRQVATSALVLSIVFLAITYYFPEWDHSSEPNHEYGLEHHEDLTPAQKLASKLAEDKEPKSSASPEPFPQDNASPSFLLTLGSFLTSVAALAGAAVTNFIMLRKEKRDQAQAKIEQQIRELELEKLRRELELGVSLPKQPKAPDDA